ncbi:unnamed protein product [Bursaphelenchus xylophilus]|uniref:(pine wood nematode) hypothetical protein n=1 Tax=Bursaphelenchus xylophilus TaxID=6326 RepID=A0A1I7RQ27_BURXY|nr:unnamed protein product [Bursaphelenchus xylophilus]CAG9097044.1 unnamed protein product [Bursaphelenchus xylophilus]
MEINVVEIIAKQCVNAEDGCVEVNRDKTKILVEIVTLKAKKLHETVLATSLYDQNAGPIAAKDDHLLANDVEVFKRIAEFFGISWVKVSPDLQTDVTYRKNGFLSHIRPAICFLELWKSIRLVFNGDYHNESLHSYALHSFQTIKTDSPGFNLLIHQLLNIYDVLSSRSVYPIFSTHIIDSDPNLWLMVSLEKLLKEQNFSAVERKNDIIKKKSSEVDYSRLWEISRAWTNWEISNYDYIMILNQFSGRIHGDPHKHPIFPWVVDFTSPDGGFRDLTKSKYRIQKGDTQLIEQYKRQPAHHIPELLSELSYTMYRARMESKENLLRFVRKQWLPEAYPANMARLFETTPDECVPEFFDDPTIFKSIHNDLPDLQLPEWTKTPEEFIKWHREMLESEEVSAHLHHWIDLVFGYLLSGPEAVEALNVHLCFVRILAENRTMGAVQLFTNPHSKRKVKSELKNSQELLPMTYPEEYFPIDRCDLIKPGESFNLSELLVRFYQQNSGTKEYVKESAISIGVTIVELCLPEFCRDLAPNASFDDRYIRAQGLVTNRPSRIPRHLRKALRILLNVTEEDNDLNKYSLSGNFYNLFFLPYQVFPVHAHLSVYHALDVEFANAIYNEDDMKIEELYMERVDILKDCVEFSDYGSLWMDHFIDLIQDLRFAVNVCKKLFYRISEFAGVDEVKILVAPISRLFEYNIPNLAKLFDRRFLIQLSIRFGTKEFLNSFLPRVIEALLSANSSLSEVSKDSILWLSKRYGPILTGKHITPNILKLLALCFSDQRRSKVSATEMSLDLETEGDKSSRVVVGCLIDLAVIYGPAMITLHYLPYCADIIDQGLRRMNLVSESALISSMELIQSCCDCLSDKQLMDDLNELIVDRIFVPIARLLSSPNVSFSSDDSRRLLACKAIRSFHLLSCRLGGENVQRYMKVVLQKLFSAFSMLYDIEREDSKEVIRVGKCSPHQLVATFCPEFALLLLKAFSRICGRKYLIDLIPDPVLVTHLAMKSSDDLQDGKVIPIQSKNPFESLSSILKLSHVVETPPPSSIVASFGSGNRLFLQEDMSDEHIKEVMPSNFDPGSNNSLHSKMGSDVSPHLSENWVQRFRSALSATTDNLTFDQINLVTYSGHTGTVKKIRVLDNENSFISASSDKTVKVWSIKTSEEASQCQWTYRNHTKPIQDVLFMPVSSMIVSADSSVHVWDPFRGSVIHQANWPTGSSDQSIVSLQKINNYAVVAGSNSDQVIRVMDLRMGSWSCHFLAGIPQSNISGLKCLAASPSGHKLAVALSNGSISLIDSRTGKLMALSFQQNTDIFNIEWLDETHFVSLYVDHSVTVWRIDSGLKTEYKLPEVAQFLCRCSDDQFLTLNANRMRLYCRDKCHSEIKLRSEFIQGQISVITPLDLNNMFLVGSSSGMIRLSC